MIQPYPRIVIAGVSSGVGKTTITTALIAALHAQGLQVQPFKVGPDYIDPSHLAHAASQPCYNLDTWMIPPPRMHSLFCTLAAPSDVAVIEGMMGLYDGYKSTSDEGSTAEVAKLLEAPVVLVLDASAMARSAAAVVLGFQRLDPAIQIAGVIANRVGGAGHAHILREAIEAETGVPLLGFMSQSVDLLMPERHLGLIPVAEQVVHAQYLAQLGQQFRRTCDVERLLQLAREAPALEKSADDPFALPSAMSEPVRIALAKDEAFNFYYPDTLRLLQQAGAQLVPFSPLHDHKLPEHIAGMYLGGGFPEEFAQRLSANESMRIALMRLLEQDIPCYAECGGLMYLCESMRVPSGEVFPMVGAIARQSVLPAERSEVVIGYREALVLRDTLLTRRGEVVRGHEFHLSSLNVPFPQEEAAYEIPLLHQTEGITYGNLLASYIHLSFSGFPVAAQRFVHAASVWKAG